MPIFDILLRTQTDSDVGPSVLLDTHEGPNARREAHLAHIKFTGFLRVSLGDSPTITDLNGVREAIWKFDNRPYKYAWAVLYMRERPQQ